MKRLLITLSVLGCLFADIDVVGNWKLSGLKVDYMHIARETTDVEVCDLGSGTICVTLQTIPAGVVFTTFVNGPFTMPIIDAVQLNLNVNLWPNGTGYIAEGSYYPDIDLIPGTCITSPQIFPVTDEFVYELAAQQTFAPANIIGTASANDLAGAGNEVYGFGVSQSGTFDGWPSTPLPERVPPGLPYVALTDGTVLGYACGTACFGTNGTDGIAAANFGGDIATCTGYCESLDYAGALAGFGGAGWLHGSGSSGSIALNQGNSQMGQDLNVDLELEWNSIDGVTSQSGIDLDDEDGDGDSTELNRIFGLPYLSSTYISNDPACDITGGGGLNYPLVGDIISELGKVVCLQLSGGATDDCAALGSSNEAALAGYLTGECISTVQGLCNAAGSPAALTAGGCFQAVAAGAYDGCIASVTPVVVGLCDAYGSPANSVTALCSDAAAGDANGNGTPDVQEACMAYGVEAAVGGACQALGFSAEICASAGGVAAAGIADACQSGVEAGANAACAQAGGLWNTLYGGCLAQGGDEATCGAAATAGVAGYGDCATWAAVTYADATCADAGTSDCEVLVSSEFVTEMCTFIGATLTCSDAPEGQDCTCDYWASTVADGFAAQDAATGYQSCTDFAAGLAAGLAVGDATTLATLDYLASGSAATGYNTCSDLGAAQAAYSCDMDAWADGFAANVLGETCTQYGDTYIADCVVINPLNDPAFGGGYTAGATTMYVMNPDLTTWGMFLTYNAINVLGYQAAGYSIAEIAGLFPELFINDSDHDFDGTNGRMVMEYEPTCIPELEARQIVAEFVSLDQLCEPTGDANNDGVTNVVDIVRIVAHILQSDTNGDGIPDLLGGIQGCQADITGEGIINVVDVVAIVSIVLGNKHVETNDATQATISIANNQITIKANGYVGGVELLVEHVGDLEVAFADNYVSEYEVYDDNTARILVVGDGSKGITDVLTITNGHVTSILESVIATSKGALSTDSVTYEEPATYVVGNAYPNPFNPSTNISLELNTAADLSVKVYNLMGQLVEVIAEGSYSPDTYSWTWNAENLASGVYLVKTQVGSDVSTQKVMLLK